MSHPRKWLRFMAGLLLTGVFLYMAFGQLDGNRLVENINFAAIPLFMALIFLSLGYVTRILRWWWMLRTLDSTLPFRSCTGPFLVSIAVNNLLPFRAGDLVRVIGFRKQLNAPVMRLAGTLFVERLLDLTVLLTFLFVGSMAISTDMFPTSFLNAAQWVAMITLSVLVALVVVPEKIHLLAAWAIRWMRIDRTGNHLRTDRFLVQFFHTLELLKSHSTLIRLLALSVLVWLFEGAVFFAVSWALLSPLGVAGSAFTVATGTLATLLPSTPGYVGTFDYFAMLGAMVYGHEREWAAAFALMVHIMLWAPLTIAGLLCLLLPRGRSLWKSAHDTQFGGD